jgi:uncharacterized BrkB/YihY/UPF0761 family membrane protein
MDSSTDGQTLLTSETWSRLEREKEDWLESLLEEERMKMFVSVSFAAFLSLFFAIVVMVWLYSLVVVAQEQQLKQQNNRQNNNVNVTVTGSPSR